MAERLSLRHRTYEVSSKGAIDPEEARNLLIKAIREFPAEELRNTQVLFASFRGGQVTVIV